MFHLTAHSFHAQYKENHKVATMMQRALAAVKARKTF